MEMRLLLSLLVLTLSPGAASADSIQSAAAQVSAAGGGTVALRCSYNTSYNAAYYLYWYRQYPNRTLQYLLYRGTKTTKSASSTADFARDRFSSETDDTSTETKITALERADTAVYHCALQEAQRRRHKGELYKKPSCLHKQVGPCRDTSEDTLKSSCCPLGAPWRRGSARRDSLCHERFVRRSRFGCGCNSLLPLRGPEQLSHDPGCTGTGTEALQWGSSYLKCASVPSSQGVGKGRGASSLLTYDAAWSR